MRKIYLCALTVAGLFAATACGNGNKERKASEAVSTETKDLKFESYTYDYIGEFISSDTLDTPGGKYVKFSAEGVLPQDMGDKDVALLRDSLIKLAGIAIYDDGRPGPLMPDSMQLTELNAAETEACGYDASLLAATLVTPRVVVWEVEREGYPCLAAHGNHATYYVNYCIADGKIVSLNEMFRPNSDKKLAAIIRKEVAKMGVDLLCKPSEVPVSSQFELTSDGINFSYDPYEIAPYSEGTVKVHVSLGDLVDLLSGHGYYVLTGQKRSE